MNLKFTATLGAAIGLVVSGGILALLWLGVSGVLDVGRIDLMYVIWPSSLMLIGGWHTTPFGILVTICSIVTNCLLYAGVALILRWGVGLIINFSSAKSNRI
jgi:hypothetical protein